MQDDSSRLTGGADAPEESEDMEKVGRAKEALRFLDKMVKMRNLFGPEHSNVEASRTEFKSKMTAFLEEYGELALDLDGDKFKYFGVAVSDQSGGRGAKDNYCTKLFQAGIIELKILWS